jgi:hypothetical protein
MKQDFESKISEITQEYREIAKSKTTIDELEDIAWEYHKKIGNIFMTGIASDKGDGRNLELPETLYNSNGKKPKNKGVKKKTY